MKFSKNANSKVIFFVYFILRKNDWLKLKIKFFFTKKIEQKALESTTVMIKERLRVQNALDEADKIKEFELDNEVGWEKI